MIVPYFSGKSIMKLHHLTLVFLILSFTLKSQVHWKVKEDYKVKFSNGGIEGHFSGLKAEIWFDEKHPTKGEFIARIDAKTLNTAKPEMTEHAKEAIEAEKFPEISFTSTAIQKTAAGYEMTGKLTLKGISKEIKFPFFFDSGKDSPLFPFVPKETFSGKMIIQSKDFNITRKGTPSELYIELNIPVRKI